MTTVDQTLIQVFSKFNDKIHVLPKKDKKILLSFTKQLQNGLFLTENQGNLLVKILKENLPLLKTIDSRVETAIFEKKWSKDFRILQKIKKIYIDDKNSTTFIVEFTFNKSLKDKFSKIVPEIKGNVVSSGIKYIILLNEHNIKLIVDLFIKDNFDIDDTILNLYQEIIKIYENQKSYFDIFNEDTNLRKIVEKNVGTIDKTNMLHLLDNRIRHQYQITDEIENDSLSFKIAKRKNRLVYINSTETKLYDIAKSIKELNRYPILFIFEGRSSIKDVKHLHMIKKSFETDNVGIYFRYKKNEDIGNFNETIAELKYNKILNNDLLIAGINYAKLPKFMIDSEWKPKTIISFTNSFKSNRTFVYCNDVDLVIYYVDHKLLNEKIYEIV